VRAGLLLALAYLLAPGHPLTWLTGVPLNPLSLAGTVLLGLAAFAFWPLNDRPGSRIVRGGVGLLAAMLAVKLLLAAAALPHGLPGWYYANGRFQGAHERSTEFPRESATRRDRELDFGGDEFPVYFLNDSQRFNFFGAEAERRQTLPFSVRWQGILYVPDGGERRFWLTASGPATLAIDGRRVAGVDADGSATATVVLPLTAGSHTVQVRYARRPPRSGELRVEWERDGRAEALAAAYLFPAPISPDAWQRDRWVLLAARVLDVLFLSLLAAAFTWLLTGRGARVRHARDGHWPLVERPLLALFLLVVFAHATIPRLDRVDKMALLGGGQDWLTHETLARDILVNGPLMTLGKPLGEGRTYYAQPFYPYALAGMHWLTGEDQFGPLVLQLFGLGLAGVLLYFLAKRLFGVPAAVATLILFAGLRAWQLDWVARRLLSENAYFVILPAALLCLVRAVDERRQRDLVLSGLFLGLAVVTRAPTLLYLPFALGLVGAGLRRQGLPKARVAGALALLLAVCLAVVGLVPLRNLVVAGQPAIVASSGGVNLEKLHRPTANVRLNEAPRRWYAPYVQDVATREVLEFILQDPVGYFATYAPLALYTLGYGAALEESHVAVWPDLVLLNVAYLGTIVSSRRVRTLRALLLHAFVAVHFLTMVVFAPYDYDNRLVLPMYLPIVVVAGFGVASMAEWVRTRPRRGAEHVAPERAVAVTRGRLS
jgi:dolichyl-phosphate-mannose-protein mannosyltransferase/PA14 domain-containing protein